LFIFIKLLDISQYLFRESATFNFSLGWDGFHFCFSGRLFLNFFNYNFLHKYFYSDFISFSKSTTWVAEMYARTHPDEVRNDEDFIYEATRAGSFGLLIFSFISVVAGIFVPQLTSYSLLTSIYNIYTASHIIFFIIMMSTFFVHTEYDAISVLAIIGVPWAVAMWAPFALVGEFVQKESDEAITENTLVRPTEHHDIETDAPLASSSSSPLMTEDVQIEEEEEEEEE